MKTQKYIEHIEKSINVNKQQKKILDQSYTYDDVQLYNLEEKLTHSIMSRVVKVKRRDQRSGKTEMTDCIDIILHWIISIKVLE